MVFISCCQCCNFKHTQVLSETVSKALYFSHNETAFKTVYSILKMDHLDCLVILTRKVQEKSVSVATGGKCDIAAVSTLRFSHCLCSSLGMYWIILIHEKR